MARVNGGSHSFTYYPHVSSRLSTSGRSHTRCRLYTTNCKKKHTINYNMLKWKNMDLHAVKIKWKINITQIKNKHKFTSQL